MTAWNRRHAMTALASGIGLPWATVAASKEAPIPIDAFFGPAQLRGAALSPNGRQVAMTVGAAGKGPARLAVLDLATMRSQALASIADSDVESFSWVNDEWLVFDTSVKLTGYRRVDYGPGLYRISHQGQQMRELVSTTGLPADGVDRGVLHPHHALKPLPGKPLSDEVLLIRPEEVSRDRIGHFAVRWLNVRTQWVREVQTPPNAYSWAFDREGQVRAVTTQEGAQAAFHWRETDGAWRVLHRYDALDGYGWHPLYVEDNNRVWVVAGHQGRSAVYTLDARSGELSAKPVAHHPQFDVEPVLLVHKGRVIGLRYTIDAEVTQWLEPVWQDLQRQVDQLLPTTSNRLSLPGHGDSPWVLVESASDQQPYRAFVFNRETQKLTRLGDRHPSIPARQMGQTDLHWIKARDGANLPVWLTLPANGPREKLPLVVWVHGGPWTRGMSWQWHPEVQFLASRGYAVIQPEFRGSTGYGHAHFKAGWKQWGQAMQTDLVDAARWAIARGTADAQRVGILGASYGGYATLMGLAQNPELFKVGVAWAAVTDLDMLYGLRWSDLTAETRQLGLPRLLGDRVTDAEMLAAHSPLKLASRIRNPLLLAHGAWDARVPLDHADALRKALKPHNPQVEWVQYPDEGHGWRQPENQIDFWRRVERFLAQHLTP